MASSGGLSEDEKTLMEMDLYGLLGCDTTATVTKLKKGYKEQALICHPGMNYQCKCECKKKKKIYECVVVFFEKNR